MGVVVHYDYLVKKNFNKGNIFKDYSTVAYRSSVNIDMNICNDYKTYDKNYAMNKEIDEYIENNTKEMMKALDELKLSYEDDIKSIDGIY
jgi:hypothetical protein